MSKETYARMLGIFVMLTLALAGLLAIPAGASAEGTANLKVLVKNQKEENLDSAMVYAVNVHTGMKYDLEWSDVEGWFEADVVPGTYQVYASSEGYISPVEPQMVLSVTGDNDDVPQIIIKLTRIDNSANVRIQVTDGVDEIEDAEVHLFGDGDVHLKEMTTPKGWANFTTPNGILHLLVFSQGKLAHSEEIDVNNTYTSTVALDDEPSSDEGSYRIMGLVKSGNVFVPGLSLHIWDATFGHMVPTRAAEDGALSIPLYPATFHLLVEAEGYEPLWIPGIDLAGGDHYYRPHNNTFEMTAISTEESLMTTIDLTGDGGIVEPVITTVWTLDANSRLYGTPCGFGSPRMQASGRFYTADWETLESDEVRATEDTLEGFGPTWITTDDMFSVNGEAFTAVADGYSVMIEDLLGNITDSANPVVTMECGYTSELVLEEDETLRVEVLSVFDDETIEVILPDDYEILGDFGDKAEFPDGNTSRLMVKEPLEFNAKKEKRPVADLDFISSKDSYKVEDKKYIVKLDENVTLSAKSSSDPVGTIVEYHWMNIPASAFIWIDDEKVPYEADLAMELDEIVIQFTANMGSYLNISIQVKDSSGLLSSEKDWIRIMADGALPVINNYTVSVVTENDDGTQSRELLDEPYEVDEDAKIEFNVSATDNGVIVDHIWTFSDGSGSVNGQIITHRFNDPGLYNISLKVKDAVGNEREAGNRTILVRDITPPMSVIKPFEAVDIKVGDDVEFNGSQSYDPRTTGDLKEGLTYEWSYYEEGDEENVTYIGQGEVFVFNFTKPGIFMVNLTVTDEAGIKGWSERRITINGVNLVVENIEFIKPDENGLKKGEKTKMSILVKNIGKVDAEGSFDIVLYRVGKDATKEKEMKRETLPDGLAAGDSYYWNLTFTPDFDGEYELIVRVDPDNEIDEDSETDNELTRPVTFKETKSSLAQYWYVIPIIIIILLVAYVIFMKYSRGLWGYEPIVDWWNKRNA